MKLTLPEDLAVAERLPGAARPAGAPGSGFDVHAFAPDRPLILCGVRIPHELGLAGHSDADVAFHAVTDAVLGTIGAGDIGSHFPPSDPHWRDAELGHVPAPCGGAAGRARRADRECRPGDRLRAPEDRAAPGGDDGAAGRGAGARSGPGERQGHDQRAAWASPAAAKASRRRRWSAWRWGAERMAPVSAGLRPAGRPPCSRPASGQGLRLATAKSCTGGLIVGCLTEIAGSSAVVDRGYVVYDNRAKVEMLGVREATLAAHGAVSEATAREMVRGRPASSGCDLAVAVTGIAGPGGGSAGQARGPGPSRRWPAGRGRSATQRRVFAGDRAAVRLATVEAALRSPWRWSAMSHVNQLGQPIGEPVPGWARAAATGPHADRRAGSAASSRSTPPATPRALFEANRRDAEGGCGPTWPMARSHPPEAYRAWAEAAAESRGSAVPRHRRPSQRAGRGRRRLPADRARRRA